MARTRAAALGGARQAMGRVLDVVMSAGMCTTSRQEQGMVPEVAGGASDGSGRWAAQSCIATLRRGDSEQWGLARLDCLRGDVVLQCRIDFVSVINNKQI